MPQRSRAQRLNGLFPLSYTGVIPVSPVNFVMDDRPPTINDSKNFYIGDLWLDTSTTPPDVSDLWMLVSLAGHNATWVNFGAGDLESLTGNSGGPVFPDPAGNINTIGDGTTINVVGNPGTNTLTISTVGTGVVNSLTGNSGGAVFPIAGNINTVGDGTTITIVGNPGTHTLTASTVGTGVMSSLTGDTGGPVFPLAGNTNILGTANVITVTGNPGTHTLTLNTGGHVATSYITNPATGIAVPAAGVLTFAGTGGITVSAAGSTVTIDGSGVVSATSFPTDSGTAIPAAGLLNIIADNASNGAGASVLFTGSGNTVLLNVTDVAGNTNVGQTSGNISIGTGAFNTSFGFECMSDINNGLNNTATGFRSSFQLTNGDNNTSMGYQSLNGATTSIDSTAIGVNALSSLLTGAGNTCIGVNAGQPYNGAESFNIIIGSATTLMGGLGVVGESNVLRIGKVTGTGTGALAKAFINGIRGVTTGVNDAVAVLIDSAGQLGTTSSSMRYKNNIDHMGSVSDRLMKLEPVTFSWKSDPNCTQQIGLIAEEVEQVFPELVVHDKEGLPETVKYHELPVLLLNELKKLADRVAELEKRLD